VYVRDYYVLNDAIDEELPASDPLRCATCGLSHVTGRKCTRKGCKGALKDTIINFGDMLDADQELPAMAAAEGMQPVCHYVWVVQRQLVTKAATSWFR
jgi:hypothetical protein